MKWVGRGPNVWVLRRPDGAVYVFYEEPNRIESNYLLDNIGGDLWIWLDSYNDGSSCPLVRIC